MALERPARRREARPEPRRALVLSGGGADGAYGVGVVEALVAGRSPANDFRPLDPDIFTGTSIGSFNAAYLTSHWNRFGAATVGRLASVWRDRLADGTTSCGNGAYRIKLDPSDYLDPRCYLPNPFAAVARFATDSASLGWEGLQRAVAFAADVDETLLQRLIELVNFTSFVSRDPWSRTIREVIDFTAIRRSGRPLRIVATNWATGALRVFGNGDMSESLGPLAIEASSALPGFFPPARVGSQPFIDGSVLLNTPLKPAIDAGGQEIYIVYLDPDISALPLAEQENTLATLYRSQQIAWAAKVELDIATARRINRILGWIERTREAGKTDHPLFDHLERTHGHFEPLVIHRFSPFEDLGGVLGLLDLGAERIDGLIRQGFENAIEHDCRRAGCVFPYEASEEELHEPPD